MFFQNLSLRIKLLFFAPVFALSHVCTSVPFCSCLAPLSSFFLLLFLLRSFSLPRAQRSLLLHATQLQHRGLTSKCNREQAQGQGKQFILSNNYFKHGFHFSNNYILVSWCLDVRSSSKVGSRELKKIEDSSLLYSSLAESKILASLALKQSYSCKRACLENCTPVIGYFEELIP